MWAEWMNDFDLTVTKEEIEEYEKRKVGKDEIRKCKRKSERFNKNK